MTGLHLLRLPIEQPVLMEAGRAHGHVTDRFSVDLGYLVHGLLARLAEKPPTPFDVQQPERGDGLSASRAPLTLLAYAPFGIETFRDGAYAREAALAARAIRWTDPDGMPRAASKPVPAIAAGTTLGFRVRLCPTIRVGKHHPRFAPGAEVDPYLARVHRDMAENGLAPDDLGARQALIAGLPGREEVYRDWLADRLGSAATLVSARQVAQRDAALWRKGVPRGGPAARMYQNERPHHGQRRLIGRREAVFEGRLRVEDDVLFTSLLARGVGRHRAFGFGMLLLRAA